MFSDEEAASSARLFVQNFLESWKKRHLDTDQSNVVDVALLKIYVTHTDASRLSEHVQNCQAGEEETSDILRSHQRFHCLALFNASRAHYESAFEIWSRLIRKEIADFHFPGYHFVADQLTK